jgi:hypothetical protein
MALEFKIELSGNFSGALEKNTAATEKAEGATKKHRHELETFEAEIGKAKTGLAGFEVNLEALSKGGALFTFDMAEGAKSMFEVVEGVVDLLKEGVEAVIDLGKEMVKAAADAQDLDLAISLDLEGTGVSEDAIRELGESFESSRVGGKKIKEMLLPLLEQGSTDPEQLDDLATAASDIAARRKSGAAGAQAALGAFQQIGLRRQVNNRILRELAINENDFYKDLGGLLGVTAEQAKHQAEKGKLQSKTLLSVALNQIAQREGGAIGAATNASAKTVGGLLERLGRLPERYFEKLADSPALGRFQGFLTHILEVLDPESPEGQRIQTAINRLFDRMMGLFGGTEDSADGLADAIVSIIGLIGDLVPMVVDLAKWLITSADRVADIVDGVRMAIAVQSGDKTALNDIAAEVGKRKADGAIEMAALDSGRTQRNAAVVEKQDYSWAAIPKFAAGGVVDRATLALVGEAGPEAIVPLSRLGGMSGGSTIHYAPVYQVGAGADSAAMREQLEQFDRQARIEFKKILDEVLAA